MDFDAPAGRPDAQIVLDRDWSAEFTRSTRCVRRAIAVGSLAFAALLASAGAAAAAVRARVIALPASFAEVQAVAIGDVTGDQAADVVVAGDWVMVFPGDGRGALGAPRSSSLELGELDDIRDVALADVTGDPRPEIVTLLNDTTVRVLGVGADAHPVQLATSRGVVPEEAAALAVGDLTGDRRTDAMVVNGRGHLLAGDGAGRFTPTGSRFGFADDEPRGSDDLALGDLDRNGRLDVVTTGQAALNADGQRFVPAPPFQGGGFRTLADLNRDGALDLVTSESGVGDGWISTFRGAGNGRFAPWGRWTDRHGFFVVVITRCRADAARARRLDAAAGVRTRRRARFVRTTGRASPHQRPRS